eukprot:750996-Hanusia_phi.AAC.3
MSNTSVPLPEVLADDLKRLRVEGPRAPLAYELQPNPFMVEREVCTYNHLSEAVGKVAACLT